MSKIKKYIVRKHCHYSNFFPSFLKIKDSMEFKWTVKFTDSCKYEIDEPSCVNKLFGFCFGFGVHKNSVRFGWTYNKDINCIYLWSYFYRNGKLHKDKIYTSNLNVEHTYKIEIHRISSTLGNYTFRFLVDGEEVSGFEEIQSDCCFLTTLGVYFGGNTRAPHKIIVEKL